MPRAAGHHPNEPYRRRVRDRYRLLRLAGLATAAAKRASTHPERFALELRQRGQEPPEELSKVIVGGHPRGQSPEHAARAERYRALRALGLPASIASPASLRRGSTQRVMREVRQAEIAEARRGQEP